MIGAVCGIVDDDIGRTACRLAEDVCWAMPRPPGLLERVKHVRDSVQFQINEFIVFSGEAGGAG